MASKKQLQKTIDDFCLEFLRLRKVNTELISRQYHLLNVLRTREDTLNYEYKARMDSEKMIGVLRKANTELQSQQGRHLAALGRKQAQLGRQAQVFEALERTQRRLDKEIEVRTESYEYASALEKANEMGNKRITVLKNAIGSQRRRMIALVDDLDAAYNSPT